MGVLAMAKHNQMHGHPTVVTLQTPYDFVINQVLEALFDLLVVEFTLLIGNDEADLIEVFGQPRPF
jgi:hypothetical protein